MASPPPLIKIIVIEMGNETLDEVFDKIEAALTESTEENDAGLLTLAANQIVYDLSVRLGLAVRTGDKKTAREIVTKYTNFVETHELTGIKYFALPLVALKQFYEGAFGKV